jgi:short-subunit dehydrogenase
MPTNSPVCLITGGTSGLGKELVKHFIKKNFIVLTTGNTFNNADDLTNYYKKKKFLFIYKVDFSEKKNLDIFIKKLKQFKKIDILINNAGILSFKKENNSLNINKMIFVNYFAHFYITIKLLKKIKNSKLKKIINISSHAHENSTIKIKEILNTNKYDSWTIYKFSKILLIFFTYYISNHKSFKKIQCFSLNPGRINSNLGYQNNLIIRLLIKLYFIFFGSPPYVIAKRIINLILNHKQINYNGKYITNFHLSKSKKITYIYELQKKVWEKSLNLFNIKKI